MDETLPNTTITTDVNTAAELVRRIGATGTFKLTGPPTAGGAVVTQTVTFSAVNTSTGAITITDSATTSPQSLPPMRLPDR